jgi:hypothetical protein
MQQLFTLKNVGKHIIGRISSTDTHTAIYSGLLIPTKKNYRLSLYIYMGAKCGRLQRETQETCQHI